MDKYQDVGNIITRAYAFAQLKHGSTRDDSGKNYFLTHVVPVYTAVKVFTTDLDILAAALLHDTIEDTDTAYEELKEEFNERVADLVLEVTHDGQKDEYGYYFPRLKSADAILIKLCDRASNISRMECWDEKRRQKYLDKTKFWKDGSDLCRCGSPGKPRTDKGLPVGIHCDVCFNEMVFQCRQRSY